MADPFGRALRDEHLGEREAALVDRDGSDLREHPIDLYFRDVGDDDLPWAAERLSGPLLELGSGVGRHARHLQERMETVATEVSDHLVRTMRERGVETARRADMFDLGAVDWDRRFRSVFARGTQVGLAGSVAGLRAFLDDLADVTRPRATAVLDTHDPTHEGRRPSLASGRTRRQGLRTGPFTSRTATGRGRPRASGWSRPSGSARRRLPPPGRSPACDGRARGRHTTRSRWKSGERAP